MDNKIKDIMSKWAGDALITKFNIQDADSLALYAVSASNRIAFLTGLLSGISESLEVQDRKRIETAILNYENGLAEVSANSVNSIADGLRQLIGQGTGL